MPDLDKIRELIKANDSTEFFSLSTIDKQDLRNLVTLGLSAGSIERDELETSTNSGILLAQFVRLIGRAAAGQGERAAQMLDEFCRGVIQNHGGKDLVAIADLIDEFKAPIETTLMRLYGFNQNGDEASLAKLLIGIDPQLVPNGLLADAAMILEGEGFPEQAVRLADRGIAYHIKRKEAEPAFLLWMLAEGSGYAPLETLLRYLRNLHPLDPAQVTNLAGQIAEKAAQEGHQQRLIKILIAIIRIDKETPKYFTAVIRNGFPEGEIIGGRFDKIADLVDPKAPNPLEKVLTVLRFLPGLFVQIRQKMVAIVRETDGKTIWLKGPGGERFSEPFNKNDFELLAKDDYRVRMRFEPGSVRKFMSEDPIGFVTHVIEAHGRQVLDETLRSVLGSEISNSFWEKWITQVRQLLKKDRQAAVEFSARTMSFHLRGSDETK